MAQINVNIRMDKDLKKEFEEFCNDVGMSMTTAFNIFAKKVVKEHKIPFEITSDPFYSKENMDELKQRINDIKNNKNISEHELIED